MRERKQPPPERTPEPPPSEGSAALLGAIQDGIKREDAAAERFDGKTRQLLALVGVLYAVVQTIALNSYRKDQIGGDERIWIFILAAVGMGLLAFSALASFRQQSALTVLDLELERVGSLIETARSADLTVELCRDHLAMLWSRRDANFARAKRYRLTVLFAAPCVIVIAGELVVALVSRVD